MWCTCLGCRYPRFDPTSYVREKERRKQDVHSRRWALAHAHMVIHGTWYIWDISAVMHLSLDFVLLYAHDSVCRERRVHSSWLLANVSGECNVRSACVLRAERGDCTAVDCQPMALVTEDTRPVLLHPLTAHLEVCDMDIDISVHCYTVECVC